MLNFMDLNQKWFKLSCIICVSIENKMSSVEINFVKRFLNYRRFEVFFLAESGATYTRGSSSRGVGTSHCSAFQNFNTAVALQTRVC